VKIFAPDPEDTLVASKFTVRQYREAVVRKDRDAVAEAVKATLYRTLR
jgi:hypothetical protein